MDSIASTTILLTLTQTLIAITISMQIPISIPPSIPTQYYMILRHLMIQHYSIYLHLAPIQYNSMDPDNRDS